MLLYNSFFVLGKRVFFRLYYKMLGCDILKIGFIGAGKVGSNLGIYFKNLNEEIVGYYSSKYQDALDASNLTNSVAFLESEELVDASNLVFITVNDDSIEVVANLISEMDVDFKEKIFIHTSGAHSNEVLNSLEKKGGRTVSLHPIQSFSNDENIQNDLKNTVFSLDNEIVEIINILNKGKNEYITIDKKDKGKYHMASVIASNFLVATVDYALDIFKEIGIDKEIGLKALSPLIRGTTQNILELGTDDALSGPILRGDCKTVKLHLEALKDTSEKENYSIENLYAELARKNLDIALSKSLSKEKGIEIEELLKDINKNYK